MPPTLIIVLFSSRLGTITESLIGVTVMNDTQSTALTLANVKAHSGESPEADTFKLGLVAIMVLFLAFTWHSIEAWADGQERRFWRRQLRDAYRRRHHWKKADIGRLRSLGVSPTAERRMRRLSGQGRPVIRQPRELHEEIVEKFGAIGALINGSASSRERLQALKQWPWWRHDVEALYRGSMSLPGSRALGRHRPKPNGWSVESWEFLGRRSTRFVGRYGRCNRSIRNRQTFRK